MAEIGREILEERVRGLQVSTLRQYDEKPVVENLPQQQEPCKIHDKVTQSVGVSEKTYEAISGIGVRQGRGTPSMFHRTGMCI